MTPMSRVLFGVSVVAFAVISLMWHESTTWQLVHPLSPPLATVVAWCLVIAQVIGGFSILYPRTARFGSVVIGAVYAVFTLACIPGIVRAPTTDAQYVNFFEQFAIVCGALAVFASVAANAASLRRLARLGFGLCAISFGIAQIVYLQFTASLVPVWLPPNQVFWTNLTTIAFLAAAVAILINRQAGLALRLMVLMLAVFGVLVWIPHLVTQPADLSNWSEFAENFMIAGAAWVVADSFPDSRRAARGRA